MDIDAAMNFLIHILALFGLILVLFLLVKFVFWCLMCDIGSSDSSEHETAKLQFELDRINDKRKQKKQAQLNTGSYRRASGSYAGSLRRSPELERLNSENFSASENEVKIDRDTDCDEDSVNNEIIEEIEKITRESESPEAHYAQVDREYKARKCAKRSDSSMSQCVCPFCPSGRTTAELSVSVEIESPTPNDDVQIVIPESEVNQESQKSEAPEVDKPEQTNEPAPTETEPSYHKQTEESDAFKELDNALVEIEEVVTDLIKQTEKESQGQNGSVESPETTEIVENGKPRVPIKPRNLPLKTPVHEPQCVKYSHVVNEIKERHSILVTPDDVRN